MIRAEEEPLEKSPIEGCSQNQKIENVTNRPDIGRKEINVGKLQVKERLNDFLDDGRKIPTMKKKDQKRMEEDENREQNQKYITESVMRNEKDIEDKVKQGHYYYYYVDYQITENSEKQREGQRKIREYARKELGLAVREQNAMRTRHQEQVGKIAMEREGGQEESYKISKERKDTREYITLNMKEGQADQEQRDLIVRKRLCQE